MTTMRRTEEDVEDCEDCEEQPSERCVAGMFLCADCEAARACEEECETGVRS